MGNRRSQEKATSAAEMRDDAKGAQQWKGQPAAAASGSSASLVPSTGDTQAASLARQSKRREDDERDPSEQERRRVESSIATKATAREARHAAALAAQSAQWRLLSPAQRLFTDGIASCLGFLNFADFNSAAQSCKQWREGAHAVKSLGRTMQFQSEASAVLPLLLASPFRRLVKTFIDSDLVYGQSSLGPAQLHNFHTLSNLAKLVLGLDLALFVGAAPIQYPPLLTAATLGLGPSIPKAGHTFDASIIIGGLASCPALGCLTLILSQDAIILTALGALKQLRQLSLIGYVSLHYTSATLGAIKTLSQLERLELNGDDEAVDPLQPQWLIPLLTSPHQLQKLQRMDTECFHLWDNDVCLTLLPSLTALTHLQSSATSVLALPVLAAFTQLRTLSLDFDGALDLHLHEGNGGVIAAYDDHEWARLFVLVPHLAHCSLTGLTLRRIVCDAESLAALCNSQPLLAGLRLHNAALTTLQPLAALSQLSQLSVDLAEHSDPLPDLFDQVCACKSLQTLALSGIALGLSEDQQQQLTPPSTVLPLLTMFQYDPR